MASSLDEVLQDGQTTGVKQWGEDIPRGPIETDSQDTRALHSQDPRFPRCIAGYFALGHDRPPEHLHPRGGGMFARGLAWYLPPAQPV